MGGGNISDEAFLMEQMELREELAEAKHQADPYAAVADLMKHIDSSYSCLTERD